LKNEGNDYRTKIDQEIGRYKHVSNVHELPDIFHYWSHKYLAPMLSEFGYSGVDQFFAENLFQSAVQVKMKLVPAFISIGSGNCDLEIKVAKLLKEKWLQKFEMECLEINPHMLKRGAQLAEAENVSEHMVFTEADFNDWQPTRIYAGVMANHSLHHVTHLERLFGAIKASLHYAGKFIVNDMIGRNGHLRWPEALDEVHRFWNKLPDTYRYNYQLKRHEPLYENWDCSNEGFEGIRAEDILPLLVDRFDFEVFVGFSNIVSIFIDRCFGHNFDATAEWDRSFIDEVHAADEEGFLSGKLKPTQMFAVMTPGIAANHRYSRGINPNMAVRWQDIGSKI
jgi:ubiquinone/menaquinone biosynthesis C-methylase UbiE